MLGIGLAGDETGEVADLRRNLTERADEKAGHVPLRRLWHALVHRGSKRTKRSRRRAGKPSGVPVLLKAKSLSADNNSTAAGRPAGFPMGV